MISQLIYIGNQLKHAQLSISIQIIPIEHKISAFLYYINRLTIMPINESSKQREWETIIAIARSNNFPTSMLYGLKTKIIKRKRQKQKQMQQRQEIIKQRDKWVNFTYFSPLVRRVTDLFRRTRLRITFRTANTIQQQLNTAKHARYDSSGIYRLKCNTCNRVYVGQSDCQ